MSNCFDAYSLGMSQKLVTENLQSVHQVIVEVSIHFGQDSQMWTMLNKLVDKSS